MATVGMDSVEDKVKTKEIVSEVPNDRQAPVLYWITVLGLLAVVGAALYFGHDLTKAGMPDETQGNIALVAVTALAGLLLRKPQG